MTTTIDGMTVEVRRDWRRTEKGCWTMTLRLSGTTVRVTQRTPDGPSCRILFLKRTSSTEPTSKSDQSWASLCTRDKDVARRRAEAFLWALAANMSNDNQPPSPSPTEPAVRPLNIECEAQATASLSLKRLTTLFLESGRFRLLKPNTRYDLTRRATILLAGLGPDTAVDDLDEDRFDLYVGARRAGGIGYQITPRSRTGNELPARDKVTRPVRDRSIQADLKLLRSMILWALVKKVAGGQRLLTDDPMAGYKILEESSPRRPIATDERFSNTLAAIDRLVAGADEVKLKLQYQMLALALKALDGTGRRISAILGLCWSDIILLEEQGVAQPNIRFARTLDKAGRGTWLPLAWPVYEAFVEWKKRCPESPAGLVFPGVSDTVAIRSDWMGELLGRAESFAGLAPLNGSLFHAYRRRFATAREHIPFNRVMELMGITDAKVFRSCYCRTSSDSLREALGNARPVTDPRFELAA